jgi:divalent metal cation (Fe/Co/Zn/Cd) transporter
MPDRRKPSIANGGAREGLVVSVASCAWTVAAGAAAIAIGSLSSSLVLVAIGMIGLLDGAGSLSLIVHFRHALRHQAVSERYERLALRLVTAGMAAIGVATAAAGAYRLSSQTVADPGVPGIVLTGTSVVALVVLAGRKRSIAKRIPSPALNADGWVSVIGALLALIALAGTGVGAAIGGSWFDPLAAMVVACGAIALSIALAQGPHNWS